MAKKVKRVLCLLMAAAMLFTMLPSLSFAEDKTQEGVNVPILHVTASSEADGHGAEYLIDGLFSDDAKSWSPSEKPDPEHTQTVILDLGEATPVGVFEAAVAEGKGVRSYEIHLSTDGVSYKKVAEKTVESSRTLFVQWDTVSARYVKLVIKEVFAENCFLNEITLFEDILPHRVGVLAGFPDMAHFGEAGMQALRDENIQLVNLCVSVADPNSPGINILPELIDDELYPNGISIEEALDYVRDPSHYYWEYADGIFGKFISEGFDIWLGFQGFTERAFPGIYTDIVDESGRTVHHRDFFNDTANEIVIEIAKQTMMHFDNNPHIRFYSLLGPGWFGGIEYYSGSNPELLAVYSDSAQAKFRAWLEEKYSTIDALNASWGTSYGTFDEVVMPKPDRNNQAPVDLRPDWADLMIWKIDYMDRFIDRYMTTMRSVSDKPVHAECDGGYQSAPMETGESMGKIIQTFQKYGNIVYGCSNLDASYGVAQFAATTKFYQVENGATMDDTGQLEEQKHRNNAFNFLSRGIGTLAHCSLGADFSEYSNGKWDPDGAYSGTDIYHWTKTNTEKYTLLDAEGSTSDVVIFNPWYANLFRQGYDTATARAV